MIDVPGVNSPAAPANESPGEAAARRDDQFEQFKARLKGPPYGQSRNTALAVARQIEMVQILWAYAICLSPVYDILGYFLTTTTIALSDSADPTQTSQSTSWNPV